MGDGAPSPVSGRYPCAMTLTAPPPPFIPPVMSTTTPRPAGETTLAASLQAEVAFAAPAIGAAAEAAAASATVERAVLADDILERGDSGAVVRDLQSRLGVLGYGVHVDGAGSGLQAQHVVNAVGVSGRCSRQRCGMLRQRGGRRRAWRHGPAREAGTQAVQQLVGL